MNIIVGYINIVIVSFFIPYCTIVTFRMYNLFYNQLAAHYELVDPDTIHSNTSVFQQRSSDVWKSVAFKSLWVQVEYVWWCCRVHVECVWLFCRVHVECVEANTPTLEPRVFLSLSNCVFRDIFAILVYFWNSTILSNTSVHPTKSYHPALRWQWDFGTNYADIVALCDITYWGVI